MAQYPTAVASFPTRETLRSIDPEHINAIQDEIAAITAALLNGMEHGLFPTTDGARDLGSGALNWRDLLLSQHLTVGGALDVTGTAAAADVSVTGALDAATLAGSGAGITGVTGAATPMPSGTILAFGGAAAPADWLLCDGTAVDRTTYADLFAVIGETFGVGDGATTFNLPDMQQRFPIGAGTLGDTGGDIDHDHSVPAHSHAFGTLAVDSHSHDDGTLACASHDHTDGTLATASGGSHSHTVDSHNHSAGTYAVGSHTHSISSVFGGSINAPPPGGTSGITSLTSPTGSTAPSFSGSSGSTAPGTSSDGSHTHTISGTTGSATPGVSGSTGSSQPALSGSVDDDAGSTSGTANPAYLVVNFIIRT
jgi:microcystin-dependent protein